MVALIACRAGGLTHHHQSPVAGLESEGPRRLQSVTGPEGKQMKTIRITPVGKSVRLRAPDLFDWAAELERRQANYSVRWIARHSRVSLTTARIIADHLGFPANGGQR